MLVVVAGGPESIVVCGAFVSTVNERLAGVGSTLPAASHARTSNVYAPSASAEVVCGETQVANAAAPTRHSKVDAGSLENANVGVESLVGPLGPESIVVSGAVASTENERVAGVPSTLPAASVAWTAKVCAPSPSAAVVCGDVQLANAPPSSAALEARAGLARERERGRVVAGRTCRSAVDARLRRLRVHREGAARRRVVDVAGGVGRAHLEGVSAVRKRARGQRRAAGGELGGVEAALEARAGLARESEGRRRVARRPARAGVDRGLRRRRVHRPCSARGCPVHVAGGVGCTNLEGVFAVGERAQDRAGSCTTRTHRRRACTRRSRPRSPRRRRTRPSSA